jgi:phosphoribosylformylglycinamidine synthase subunit PurS
MAAWDVQVKVWLKPSVFDPQGHAVEQALQTLGFAGVEQVRVGKHMSLRVHTQTQAEAEAKVTQICETVLCNPVMETYAYEIHAVDVEALA